jgi:hypothetical protein
MESIDLIALCDADKTIIGGGDGVLFSEFNYYMK